MEIAIVLLLWIIGYGIEIGQQLPRRGSHV